MAALQPGPGARAPPPVNDHGPGRRGKALRLSTTVTSRPLIPVAVPEAASHGCNFQVGPGPRATPLLNQSLNQSYPISWLSGQSSLASRKWCTGACLLPGTLAGFDLMSSLSLSSSPQLSCLKESMPLSPPPSLTPRLPHQLQTFLAPPHGLNHAFLLPKGPQLGFLPDNLTICADKCRGLFPQKKNGKMAQKLKNLPPFLTLLHPLPILQNA